MISAHLSIRHALPGIATLAALLLPATTLASETASTPGVSLAAMLQTFLGLALVLGLFIGAAWLLRRLNGGAGLLGQQGPMKIVGGLPIGTRERIILVEIEDTWLVIGIAPGQMRTLHTLPKGSVPLPTDDSPQFGRWLKHFKERNRDATD